jgi:hypothetical protein
LCSIREEEWREGVEVGRNENRTSKPVQILGLDIEWKTHGLGNRREKMGRWFQENEDDWEHDRNDVPGDGVSMKR